MSEPKLNFINQNRVVYLNFKVTGVMPVMWVTPADTSSCGWTDIKNTRTLCMMTLTIVLKCTEKSAKTNLIVLVMKLYIRHLRPSLHV